MIYIIFMCAYDTLIFYFIFYIYSYISDIISFLKYFKMINIILLQLYNSYDMSYHIF